MRAYLESFCRRWWILLCGVPIVVLFLYQLGKSRLSWHFAANLGQPELIHGDAFLLILFGLICALASVFFYRPIKNLAVALIALSTIAASVGVWMQKDRTNSWIGADVPTNNYRAALLTLDIGPYGLVNSWNARGNPYADSSGLPHPEEVIRKLSGLKLGWVVGDRWQVRNLPQDNNRMQQHPPGYPLVMAAWLRIFGRTRTAAELFELFVKLCVVVMAAWWIRQRVPAEASLERITAMLLVSSAPPMLLFFEPHANELAALFAMLGLMVLDAGSRSRRRIPLCLLAGILLAGAAYTNFFNMLLLIILMIAIACAREAWKSGLLFYALAGAAAVVAVFFLLGYYPWLTYVTGAHLTYYYRQSMPFDPLSSLLDFLYFGFPLLIITALSFFNLLRIEGRILKYCMVGVAITLALGAYQSFALASTSRYLMGVVLLFVPVFCKVMIKLNLKRWQVAVIPIVNFLFLIIILFL